jgi:hypothetical protein
MRAARLFLIASLLYAPVLHAQAVNAGDTFNGCIEDFSVNLRDSYDICPGRIRERMLEGKDPPAQWITRGGTGQDSQSGAYEMSTRGMISTGLKNARNAVPHYQDTGCDYDDAGSLTKPGGDTVRGSRDACESNGVGEPSFGPPDIELLPIIPMTRQITDCVTGLYGSFTPRSNGGCVSGGVNVCGLGSIGGNVCAGPNGVRANGRATMTGIDSVSVAGAQDLGPAGAAINDVSALRGPISVAGDTVLELADGTAINVAADSVITTTTDNWVQIRDSAGTLLSEYDLTATGGAATLKVPDAGIDIDPGALNANNYSAMSSQPNQNLLPQCFMNQTDC